MRSEAKTPQEYLESLPEDRNYALLKLRGIILQNLPKGFEGDHELWHVGISIEITG